MAVCALIHLHKCAKGDMYCTRTQVRTLWPLSGAWSREMKSREIFDSRTFTRTYSGPSAEKRSSPVTTVLLRSECYDYVLRYEDLKDSYVAFTTSEILIYGNYSHANFF